MAKAFSLASAPAILLLALCFIFSGSFFLYSCAPAINPVHVTIQEWVTKEYGPDAKAEIAGELMIDQPDATNLEKWRGGIILENEKKDGIFFYNTETGEVDFRKGMGIPLTKKDGGLCMI